MRPSLSALLVSFALLGACDRAQVERIDLGDVRPAQVAEPLASPFTEEASWQVAPSGRALNFGNDNEVPFLSLSCAAPEGGAPVLTVIRHVPAQPGAKALFAVIGNGMIARFYVDATLNEGEWRWEGRYPADAAELQVFTGPRDLEATLPGGGTLKIAGSPLPREFVTWCEQRSMDSPAPGQQTGAEPALPSQPQESLPEPAAEQPAPPAEEVEAPRPSLNI